jgi:hypothetical protein
LVRLDWLTFQLATYGDKASQFVPSII